MVIGDELSCAYIMLTDDISRYGYKIFGRVWSIICPQLAFGSIKLGVANLKVAVTGK